MPLGWLIEHFCWFFTYILTYVVFVHRFNTIASQRRAKARWYGYILLIDPVTLLTDASNAVSTDKFLTWTWSTGLFYSYINLADPGLFSIYAKTRQKLRFNFFLLNGCNFHSLMRYLFFRAPGTIPVLFRGDVYHIPICIWLPDTYPVEAPICYVAPTATMRIEVSESVSKGGQVRLPYLDKWDHFQSNLRTLVEVCLLPRTYMYMIPLLGCWFFL